MRKFYLASTMSIVAAALVALPAMADEQSFDLDGFTSVDSSAGVSVDITVGSGYSIRAEGSEKALDRLRIEVKGDTLYVGRKRKVNWGKTGSVDVTVTMPALESLDSSSGSSIDASGVEASDFSADASSGSRISVSGSCTDLNADVSSGARIDAKDLECKKVIADGSSGGSISASADTRLIADASSGASIRVYGSPTDVDIDKSSGGSVKIKN